MFIELILFILLFIPIFLMHEFFHIKGDSLTNTGRIYVEKYGFHTALDKIRHSTWMYYSGGILTSIYLFIILALSWKCVFSFALLANGGIQLAYGLYEGFIQGHVTKFRYLIYISVFIITALIWYFI